MFTKETPIKSMTLVSGMQVFLVDCKENESLRVFEAEVILGVGQMPDPNTGAPKTVLVPVMETLGFTTGPHVIPFTQIQAFHVNVPKGIDEVIARANQHMDDRVKANSTLIVAKNTSNVISFQPPQR